MAQCLIVIYLMVGGVKIYAEMWQPVNLTEVCPVNSQLTSCTSFGYIYLNLLTRLYADSKDRRIQEQIRQEEEDYGIVRSVEDYSKRHDTEVYDFIVVGAGSAGCVVANRLSENKHWKVLLLEAGIEQPDVTLVPGLATALLGSNIDWKYKTEPDAKSCLARPGGRCDLPRGKLMGGTSAINSMVYIRGNKVDFDGWAAMGNPGWSYSDVLPFFKKSEKNLNIEGLNRKYHGVDGEQYISRYPYVDIPTVMLADAYHESGLPLTDHNAARQVGAMITQAISKDGERVSTNNAFIQPIRYKRRNLTVKTNSEVIKVLVDENKITYGVKYIRNEKIHTAFAKKEVIISGGAINSPKLLMLSGIGPKEHLMNLNIPLIKDLAVGENLHDHVTFSGYLVALSNRTTTLNSLEDILKEVYDYSLMKVKNGPLSFGGPISTAAFMKSDPNLSAPDIEVQLHPAIVNDFFYAFTNSDSTSILPASFYDSMYPKIMNLVPKSRGNLLLNATNPHSTPLIFANYLEDPSDIIPLIKSSRYILNLENTEAFKSRGAYFVRTRLPACRNYQWGSDDYTICLAKKYTASTDHLAGTCKMGPIHDKKAVVDPRLKVYGISGLRVIDASIMPVITRGNTNAPSIMIGERGAAFIKEDWLKKHYIN